MSLPLWILVHNLTGHWEITPAREVLLPGGPGMLCRERYAEVPDGEGTCTGTLRLRLDCDAAGKVTLIASGTATDEGDEVKVAVGNTTAHWKLDKLTGTAKVPVESSANEPFVPSPELPVAAGVQDLLIHGWRDGVTLSTLRVGSGQCKLIAAENPPFGAAHKLVLAHKGELPEGDTLISEMADVPAGDYYLAVQVARFAHMDWTSDEQEKWRVSLADLQVGARALPECVPMRSGGGEFEHCVAHELVTAADFEEGGLSLRFTATNAAVKKPGSPSRRRGAAPPKKPSALLRCTANGCSKGGSGKKYGLYTVWTLTPITEAPPAREIEWLNYSNPATWNYTVVPTEENTDVVMVPFGEYLELDIDVKIRVWVVEGVLRFAPWRSITLEAEVFVVNGGEFIIGSSLEPYAHEGVVRLWGTPADITIPIFGKKVMAITHGRVAFYG
jgi:hypothetical protein